MIENDRGVRSILSWLKNKFNAINMDNPFIAQSGAILETWKGYAIRS
jgi:hypothetical protein